MICSAMKHLQSLVLKESIFLIGLALLICWQVVMNLGIGFTWDTSRYLFYASQFSDFGNTNTAPYAPLFAISLGTLQHLGLSAPASIFVLYTTMLSSIFLILNVFKRKLDTPFLVFLTAMIAFISSEAMFMLLRRALTELGFAAIISVIFFGVYTSLESKAVSKWLMIGCMLLPLQRFIGIANSNFILIFTCAFVADTWTNKFEMYFKNAIIVNSPFVIFALTTYSVQGSFLGIRKENTTGTYATNLSLLCEVLWSHFPIEMIITIIATVLGIARMIKLMNNDVQEQSNCMTESVLMGLSGLTMLVHFTTQIYSSTNVVINPINPRYVIPLYPLFLIQLMLIVRWISSRVSDNANRLSLTSVFCIFLLKIAYNGVTTVASSQLGKHPRELGYNYAITINRIVESIQRDPGPKHIVLFEKGKIHLGFSYVEMGLFDTLSPGCQGGRILLNFGNHNTKQMQMVPDCPKSIEPNVRFTIERTIFGDENTTHILISKLGLPKAKHAQATKDLKALGFVLTDNNEHFMLYKSANN